MFTLLALAAATPPPVPISPADLLGVTDISGLAVSPDSRWLAFRTERASTVTNRVETHWWVVRTDGSAPPRSVTDGGPALWTGAGAVQVERPIWLSDSRFAYRAAFDREIQAWVADVERGESRKATAFDGDVLAIAPGNPPDGLAFAVGPSREAIRSAEQAMRDGGARVDSSVDLAVGVVGGVTGPFGAKSVRLTGDWFDRRDLFGGSAVRHFQQGADERPIGTDSGPAVAAYVFPDPGLLATICKASDCTGNRIEAIVPIAATGDHLVTTADRGERQTLNMWDGRQLRPVYRADGLVSGARVQYEPCAVGEGRLLRAGQRRPAAAAGGDRSWNRRSGHPARSERGTASENSWTRQIACVA
jgi:hypothetical protein